MNIQVRRLVNDRACRRLRSVGPCGRCRDVRWERVHQDVEVVPCIAAQARVDNKTEARPLKEPPRSRIIDSHECDARFVDAPASSSVEAAFGYGRKESYSFQPTAETARTCNQEGDVAAGLIQPLVGTSPATLRVIEAEPANASLPVEGLTDTDLLHLSAVLDHEVSRNTVTNYRAQWRSFMAWAQAKGIRGLPAEPTQVAAYLAERIEEHAHRPATLRTAASAIAFVHKAARMDDPCASPEVKKTLRSATRRAGRSQKQAEALTAEAFAVIQPNACKPRRGRGGRFESEKTARFRGNLDVAVISLMRDAMLRVSEAAALIWSDVATEADGTGRLLIRRSKTDAEGAGAVAFLSAPTMSALSLIRNLAEGAASVFGLRPNQISARIKQAARAAGLGEGFSGHSPRVGMARDLARAGIELTSLMNAGRWRTATMPAHYTRNEAAGKGAVAQFHGYCRRVA